MEPLLQRFSLLRKKGSVFNLSVSGHVVLLCSMAYLTTLSELFTLWRLMGRWNNEMQKSGTNLSIRSLSLRPKICLKRLRKTTNNQSLLSRSLIGVSNRDFPNIHVCVYINGTFPSKKRIFLTKLHVSAYAYTNQAVREDKYLKI